MPKSETIASLGENEALARSLGQLIKADSALLGPGDDAAQVSAPAGNLLVSTDTMIEGHDFRLDWSSGFDLGWKAVATNFADIAAMGGRPSALVIALAVRPDTELVWLQQFVEGLNAACLQLSPGAGVVGGDLALSETATIAVTVLGDPSGALITRGGAMPGDVIAVAGTLGRAASGLAILSAANPELAQAYDEFVISQLRPNPPISLGTAAAAAGATSMLDVSDGLARDAYRIARASKVSLALFRENFDGYCAMLEAPAQALGVDPIDWVLSGGEDHALLATFPAAATLPRGFKPIGEVIAGQSEVLLDGQPMTEAGWDSLRSQQN